MDFDNYHFQPLNGKYDAVEDDVEQNIVVNEDLNKNDLEADGLVGHFVVIPKKSGPQD